MSERCEVCDGPAAVIVRLEAGIAGPLCDQHADDVAAYVIDVHPLRSPASVEPPKETAMSEPKYAPANEQGEKPYVVRVWDWGRESVRVVYADNASDAKWRALGGRRSVTRYASSVRRAMPADLAAGEPE